MGASVLSVLVFLLSVVLFSYYVPTFFATRCDYSGVSGDC